MAGSNTVVKAARHDGSIDPDSGIDEYQSSVA